MVNRLLTVKEYALMALAALWTVVYVIFGILTVKINLFWEPAMLVLLGLGIVLAFFRYYRGGKPALSKEEHPDPAMVKFFFATERSAPMWFVLRMYVGAQWLLAGYEKAVAPGGVWWNGASLHGFAVGALAKATGAHPAVQGFYAWFLQHMVLPYAGAWGVAITLGECAVGLGILLGILTGVAAFFGVVMNLNYLLAGTVSINPVLGVFGLFLLLSWKVCGYVGLDRVLLPALGVPGGKRGTLFIQKDDLESKEQVS